jgi:hypothetical protein
VVPSVRRFPQKEPLLWTTGKFEQILNKVWEFNGKVDNSLTERESNVLREITGKLENKDASWSAEEFQVMEKIVSWPAEFRFPGNALW